MKTSSNEFAALMNRRQYLKEALAECELEIKRDHMSWIVVSTNYGVLGFHDHEIQPKTLDEAWQIARERNETIDWELDKAYRRSLSVVAWQWLDSGEQVHSIEELRFYDGKEPGTKMTPSAGQSLEAWHES